MTANSEDSSDILSSSHICNCLPVTTESCCLTVISARLTDPSPCREPPPRFLTRHLLTQKGVRGWARSRYNTHKPHLALPLSVMQKYCSDQTLNLRLHPEFQGFSSYHHYSLIVDEENHSWLRPLPFILFSRVVSLFFFFLHLFRSAMLPSFPSHGEPDANLPGTDGSVPSHSSSLPAVHRISGGRTRAADASAATCCPQTVLPTWRRRLRNRNTVRTTFYYKWTLRSLTFLTVSSRQ